MDGTEPSEPRTAVPKSKPSRVLRELPGILVACAAKVFMEDELRNSLITGRVALLIYIKDLQNALNQSGSKARQAILATNNKGHSTLRTVAAEVFWH
jgi:hypothetical protein